MKKTRGKLGVAAGVCMFIIVAVAATGARASSPELSASDAQLAKKIARQVMTGSGKAEAVRAKGSDVLQTYFPGERPWGDATESIATHDFLLVTAKQALSPSLHRGPGGSKSSAPGAYMVIYDVDNKEVVGTWAMFSASDQEKGSFDRIKTRIPTVNRSALDVPMDPVTQPVS